MTRNRYFLRGLAASCVSATALLVPQAAGQAAVAPAAAPETDLDIAMQAQQKSNWCWDASGNTVAAFWGHKLTQTRFCQIAHHESGNGCANEQGYLSDQQRVYRHLGFSDDGTYDPGGEILPFSAIKKEVDAGQPVGTRIGWTSGGGHMHVIYGYSGSTVEYGDPWPSNDRYNSMDYDDYRSNNEFRWTHTVYGVEG